MSSKHSTEKPTSERSQVSRRTFLAGSATIGLATALGAVTGCAPKVEAEPTATAESGATNPGALDSTSLDAKWSFEIPPAPITDDAISQTIETDILVIGAGPSGFSTALSALDVGATNVIVLSKASTFNALGGSMHAYNTKTSKALGYELTPDQISHELRKEWMLQSNRSDMAKWTIAAYASTDAMNWLVDYVEAEGYRTVLEIGPQDSDELHNTGPGSHSFLGDDVKIAGQGIKIGLAVMEKKIQEKGGQIIYDTSVEQLVRDNNNTGRVSAAIAKDKDGKYIKYVAKKGIVLATGCITQNDEMLAKYAPETYQVAKAGSGRLSPNTGDGTRMALWVGAAAQKNWPWATEYNVSLLYYRGDKGSLFAGARPYMMFPSMAVNQNGKRYMNEDSSMSMAATPQIRQPQMLSYSIWTANLAEALAPFQEFGRWYGDDCQYGLYDADKVIDLWESGLGDGDGVMMPIVKAKYNSIDEIAAAFEIPADTLKESVANYNTFCEQGCDSEFGKRAELLVPIDMNGPFYVMKSRPTIFEVFGGPRCDASARVLDENDQVIEGLYEVGAMMGDTYQPIYTYLFPGANIGFWCITYGYLTGKGIAEGTI